MPENKRCRWVSGVVAALALAAAGCGGSSQGQPPTRLPSIAPPVPKSWDASRYRDKPCSLFADEQAKELGYLKPGRVNSDDPDVAECVRDIGGSPDSSFTVKYYFATDLLGKIYRREIAWPANSASPITVVGQPGLRTNDIPDDVACNVVVGLAGTQGFEVRMAGRNSCERSFTVAETIMHNIIGG
ncbi:DUF3558 family protein [Actinocrispum wychmicini]|uniref:Uncharacterized protein DUF3558 n=1 Tax=Actinocrispum wychmicini TaxID=1213861 RepID=A0A4R2JCI3_9PSEU|nr:DUF3558 family protein [Actinocrispum wychmicini]TCO57273.1 uncharacterized protein DUF3558 [Actinocrispum wychmicini]